MQRFTKHAVRNNQLSEVATKKCKIGNFMSRGVSVLRKKVAAVKVLNVSVDLKDKLLDLSADEGLRNSFESNSLASFWIKIKAK